MAHPIPESFNRGGRVVRRQSTFWDLIGRNATDQWRARFIGKSEFHFVDSVFESVTLVAEHPVLMDYHEPMDTLFISSSANDPDAVLHELEVGAEKHFAGWRAMVRYLNPDFPARDLLFTGSGMLLRAPRTYVESCSEILDERGVRSESIRGSAPRKATKALLLDSNFIVAEDFVFEQVTSE